MRFGKLESLSPCCYTVSIMLRNDTVLVLKALPKLSLLVLIW
jgi:hypothetical protein